MLQGGLRVKFAQTTQTETVKATYHGESTNKVFTRQNSRNGGLEQQGVGNRRGCVEARPKCLCLNARSIKNIFLELEAVIIYEGYDIVGTTETLLGEEDGDEYNRGV